MQPFDSNYPGENVSHPAREKKIEILSRRLNFPARPAPYKGWNLQLADLESVFNYYVPRLKILFVEANKTC